jgi:hypothetical protein
MLNRNQVLATLAIVALAVLFGSFARRPTIVEEPLTEDRHRSVAYILRSALLTDLLERAEDDWAGSYVWSNGYESYEFDLAPRGFFFGYRQCVGGDWIYGSVVRVDGSLIELRPREPLDRFGGAPESSKPERRSIEFWEERVYSIPWDGERFVVPECRMREFCELVKAEGWEAMKQARYPRKRRKGVDSWRPIDRELRGLPEVPAEFRQYLTQ